MLLRCQRRRRKYHGQTAPEVARLLDRFVERADDVLLRAEFAVLVCPAVEVLAERLPGDGHVVAVNELVLEQVREHLCRCSDKKTGSILGKRGHVLGIPPIL
jgi:hypothetical protein